MLNLNYNINKAIGGGGCIGVTKFNYSASLLVAGGGAGLPPLTASKARGGGGAGFIWTGSLNIIPNVSYQILVAETSSLGGDGNESKFIGFDDNDTIPFEVTSFGGKVQIEVLPDGIFNGGPQGSGSLSRAGVVTNYAGFVGGLGAFGSRGGYNNFVGGGGAGATSNGGNGDIGAAPGAQGGIGGTTYNAADFNPTGPNQNLLIGAGGSGESIGGASAPQTIRPSEYSQGASYNGTVGAKGSVVIKYAGEPKAVVTNAGTVTIAGYTYHTFAPGTGSFIFTYPYPWSDVVPYQVEECPQQRTGFAPYVYPDPYSGSIVSAIPGTIFKQGFTNLFGMDNIWDDMSSYVRGNGTPVGSDRNITPSGSGTITSSSATPWDRYGYPSSLLIPSNSLLNAGTDSGRFTGFNIPSASFSPSGSSFNWTAECWVALPVSSSFLLPNFGIVRKENSYALDLVSFRNTGANVWVNNGESRWFGPQTASLMMTAGNISNAKQYQVNNTAGLAGSGSNTMNAFQWCHIAFSSEYSQCGPTPADGSYTIYRGFFNGREIFAAPINMCGFAGVPQYPSLDGQANPALLFDAVNEGLSEVNALVQDFRFYKGTNKNYTASFDVNTVYPIVVARPY